MIRFLSSGLIVFGVLSNLTLAQAQDASPLSDAQLRYLNAAENYVGLLSRLIDPEAVAELDRKILEEKSYSIIENQERKEQLQIEIWWVRNRLAGRIRKKEMIVVPGMNRAQIIHEILNSQSQEVELAYARADRTEQVKVKNAIFRLADSWYEFNKEKADSVLTQ